MVQLHYGREKVYRFLENLRGSMPREYYELLTEYHGFLDLQDLAVTTVYNYVVKASMFLRWMAARGFRVEEASSPRVLREYMLHLKRERMLKPGALLVHVRALRMLMKMLGAYGEARELLRLPRQEERIYQLPPPEVVERIIEEIDYLKHKVVVALLYETGARISEVLSLRVEDVREQPEGYYLLSIRRSKSVARTVPVIRYSSLLRTYLATLKRSDGPLFPSKQNPEKPIHPRKIESLLREKGLKYGVKLHPHLLRHLRGTLLAKEGYNERVIMRILGHKTHKMVGIYVNLSGRDVELALLSKYGIKKLQPGKGQVECPKCGAGNLGEANYCWRCGMPLSSKAALEEEERREAARELADKLYRLVTRNPELLKALLRGEA